MTKDQDVELTMKIADVIQGAFDCGECGTCNPEYPKYLKVAMDAHRSLETYIRELLERKPNV